MKAEPKAEAAAPKSKKMLIIGVAAAVLLLGGGGAAAWFMMQGGDKAEQKEAKKPAVKPEFVVLDKFTVNLAPEMGDQYLQIAITLQVSNLEQVELIKTNMARVRDRVLRLLSAKKASEISTVEGKGALAKEITAAINQPFSEKAAPQEVSDVLFTDFIIQ